MGRKTNKVKTKRIALRISEELHIYLEKLAKIGVHGKNSPEVAIHFIASAVAQYVKDDIMEKLKSKEGSD